MQSLGQQATLDDIQDRELDRMAKRGYRKGDESFSRGLYLEICRPEVTKFSN